MGRVYWAAALLLVLASCGSYRPPDNVNDACAIARERPRFLRAMKASERRWGVPVEVQMATIRQESGFRGNAKTPYRWMLGIIPMGRQSSAFGYAQVLNTTWRDYKNETGRWSASRENIYDATDFIGWYMDKASRVAGISKADARNQYLAYHDGIGGYMNRSYRDKGWLLAVANRVQQNSNIYGAQLRSCRLL